MSLLHSWSDIKMQKLIFISCVLIATLRGAVGLDKLRNADLSVPTNLARPLNHRLWLYCLLNGMTSWGIVSELCPSHTFLIDLFSQRFYVHKSFSKPSNPWAQICLEFGSLKSNYTSVIGSYHYTRTINCFHFKVWIPVSLFRIS